MSGVLRRLVFAAALLAAQAYGDPMRDGFRSPPSGAKPRIWWHWVNGNVSREGIRADLRAIAWAGFGGVTPIDVGWYYPEGTVKFGTPDWFDTMAFAAEEARRNGLALTIPNCSGFSSSGGPWITPDKGMKFLEWTECNVTGPSHFHAALPKINDPCGYCRDVAVLAVPSGLTMTEAGGEASVTGTTWRIDFPEPFAARGAGFALSFSGAYFAGGKLTVETSDDGKVFSRTDDIPLRLAQTGLPYDGRRFVAFRQERRVRHWRFALAGAPGGTTVSAPELYAVARIPDVRAKSLRIRMSGGAVPELPPDSAAVPKDAVLDLTDRMKDGVLDWDVPAGRWTVVRLSYAANGRKCHPASPSGEGLEVDKLCAESVAFHYDSYVGRLRKRIGAFDGVLVDSYEMRSQNWTERMPEAFERKAGYSLRPYLAVLAGFPVGSVEESERFLKDFRRAVGETFAENYAGTLAAKCHADGLKLALEPYGTMPCANFDYGRAADVPMGEHWVRARMLAHDCACPLAVSVGHFFGRKIVESEAFTAAPGQTAGRWLADPFRLKPTADRMLAEGVNRLVVHRYAHQPWADKVPGMTMGPWGTHFERTNTWWPFVRPFVAYLARAQFLLQEGEGVVDVLAYTGDDVPNEGANRKGVVDPPPRAPFGWNCDCCSGRAIDALTTEADGSVRTPGGMRYRVLAKPGENIAAVCSRAGIAPDVTLSAHADIAAFAHRHYPAWDGADAYFVAFANDKPIDVECSFRTSGRVPEIWNAEDGSVADAASWRVQEGRTVVRLELPAAGSAFVVFRRKTDALAAAPRSPDKVETVRQLDGPWQVSFASPAKTPQPTTFDSLVSLTDRPEEDVRHFSGTVAYSQKVSVDGLAGKGDRVLVDLGEVRNVARVKVGGRTVAELWRPPFRADMTDFLPSEGTFELTVEVANLWPNRLIGDAALAERERTTFTSTKLWNAGEKLLPSGLLGPVSLLRRSVPSTVRPAAVFGDRMVLQRDRPVPVWGTAAPGEKVAVAFAGNTVTGVAGSDGKWRVDLPPMPASKEFRDLVIGGRVFRDVLVGEVWFVSGQSNMELPIWGTNPHRRDEYGAMTAQTLRNRYVRYARTANYKLSETPRDDFSEPVVWKDFTKENLLNTRDEWGHGTFSAVGVYYALELYHALDVPVAVVGAYWGGTRIEPWIPFAGYDAVPHGAAFREKRRSDAKQNASVIWNEQVAPWTPFALRGMVWYQGCTSVDEPENYRELMHALYRGWAAAFANPTLKLYFAQIAPYRYDGALKEKFPLLQEAQAQFAAEEPNAGMAVTSDVGNPEDCHPNRKLAVAKRLALLAFRRDYGFDVVADSPTLKSWKVSEGKFTLAFDNVHQWYMYREDFGTDSGFEVCGDDGVWHPAAIENLVVGQKKRYGSKGHIRGAELIVASPKVPAPKALRYLYSEPWRGTVYNEVGLPIGPFHIEMQGGE